VVAAEVTNAGRDSVIFAAMVDAAERNLAGSGADQPGVFVADTGYWSIDNATLDVDADVLITPMPIAQGITDPNDPRIARRGAVIERFDRGEVTVKAAAEQMGVSTPTAHKLLKNHRSGRPDPVEVRRATPGVSLVLGDLLDPRHDATSSDQPTANPGVRLCRLGVTGLRDAVFDPAFEVAPSEA